MKKIFFGIAAAIMLLAGGLWFYRYDVVRFSVSAVMERKIPGNVSIQRIVVDLPAKKVDVYGLVIGNPAGFSDPIFADIGVLSVKYRMRGKTILTGVDITGFELSNPVVKIERLLNGRINLDEINTIPPGGDAARLPEVDIIWPAEEIETGDRTGLAKSVSEAINLTGSIPGEVRNGKVLFTDRMVLGRPFNGSLDGIESNLVFALTDRNEVAYLETEGHGYLDGDISQRLKWRISADLVPEDITLSSRIEPENVDIVRFKPYYEQYSPVEINGGRVSGTIVFDLHMGNIGSDNTLRVRGLEFSEKDTEYASRFWGTGITDVAKYLQLSSGETVFDFKIKGPIGNPRFYPGPNVTRAIQKMAVDKIGEFIRRTTQPEESEGNSPARSDMDEVIDIFKGFMQK
ncbi:MAG: DUF748 domain-containing protein [Candidatus Omnitrophota bacterium]